MDLAVYAAVGHIIGQASERRDVVAAPGVALDRDDVVSSECNKIGDLDLKGRISAGVHGRVGSVDPYFRAVGNAVKCQDKALALPFTGKHRHPSVA